MGKSGTSLGSTEFCGNSIILVSFADDTSIICKFERNENIPQKIEKIL